MLRKNFKDPFKGQRGCYHFSSSHLEKQRIFRTSDDFVFGINTLALILPGFDIQIIAYCLMDNHLHILLVGKYEQCLAYYDRVVHRIAQYVKTRYGIAGILRCEDVDIVAVMSSQQMKEEICYIHRNPYKARIASPIAYRWSSADVYFNSATSSGIQIGSMKVKEREAMFKTHMQIPDNNEHIEGRILNKSFVTYQKAMEKFRDSVEYFDLLRRFSLEAEVESKHGIEGSVVFTDSELQEKISEVCKYEFHSESPGCLDRKSLLRLARIASLRFGANQKQLSRLLNLDKEILDRIL